MNEFIKKELGLALILAPVKIVIGFVIVFLIMAVVMGSFGDAFTLILLSIICTAFISLILWVPIWYVAGYIAVALLRLALRLAGVDMDRLFGSKKRPAAAGEAQAGSSLQSLSSQLDQALSSGGSLSRDQQALVNYISKARAKGLSDEQISQNLSSNGWAVDSVSAAFQSAGT